MDSVALHAVPLPGVSLVMTAAPARSHWLARALPALLLSALVPLSLAATANAAPTTTVTAIPTANVIVNGDAESDVGSTNANGASNIDSVGWEPETGAFTVTKYGTGNFPGTADSTAIGGGQNFFSGGTQAVSTGQQTIDLTPVATTVDAGTLTFDLAAYLGGYANHGDSAQLAVRFLDGTSAALPGGITLGPVTAADRGNDTKLLRRTAAGVVPVGTRTIEVTITLSRAVGSSNDGYVDNVLLYLGAPAPTPIPAATPAPTAAPVPAATPTPKNPRPIGAGTKVAKPSAKPVIKVSKPASTPAGGSTIKVTPTTTCNLTASSTFVKPGARAARAAATKVLSGWGTSTLRVSGGIVTLPKQQFKAVTVGSPATVQVQPLTKPTKASSPKVVDPPKVSVKTTVTCVPVTSSELNRQWASIVGFAESPLSQLGIKKGGVGPRPSTVTSTVNPPSTTPSSGGGSAPPLTPGLWSGKVNGSVTAAPGGAAVPAGEVSFVVQADGTVTDLVVETAETCLAPAGSRQGGSVQSFPIFTSVEMRNPTSLTPSSGYPKKGFRVFEGLKTGTATKVIRLGTGPGSPGLTAMSPTSITGNVEAIRHAVSTDGIVSVCTLRATFNAAPGGTPVAPYTGLNRYFES